MSTQSTISNWLPDARTSSILDTPTPVSLYSESSQAVLSTVNNSRVVSNVAERGHNQPSTLAYYSGLTWSKLHGSFGPTDDGVGIVRSWVWKHGWKIESLEDRKQYWLCRQCRDWMEFGMNYPWSSIDYCQVRQATNFSRHSHIENSTGLAAELSYLFNNSPLI
jgi:hypothetical protein